MRHELKEAMTEDGSRSDQRGAKIDDDQSYG
jgi:hypothetical protein